MSAKTGPNGDRTATASIIYGHVFLFKRVKVLKNWEERLQKLQ